MVSHAIRLHVLRNTATPGSLTPRHKGTVYLSSIYLSIYLSIYISIYLSRSLRLHAERGNAGAAALAAELRKFGSGSAAAEAAARVLRATGHHVLNIYLLVLLYIY